MAGFNARYNSVMTLASSLAGKTLVSSALIDRVVLREFNMTQLAGDPVTAAIDTAPGNQAPVGGIKVTTRNGWFAARPSGTEDVLKTYAESFVSIAHLRLIREDAIGAAARIT